MQITVKIDPSWIGYPDALAEFIRRLRALEQPAAHLGTESTHPEPPAPASTPREPGDDRDYDEDLPENPPEDGRQLLGWAGKQSPDAKGAVMSFGKKNGYPSKIVTWDRRQVASAYRSVITTQQYAGR